VTDTLIKHTTGAASSCARRPPHTRPVGADGPM